MTTGPRGRWVAVAIWLLLGVADLLAHAHIDEVTAAGQGSSCPAIRNRPGRWRRSRTSPDC